MTLPREDIAPMWEATPLGEVAEQNNSQSSTDLACPNKTMPLSRDAGESHPLSYSQSMFWIAYTFQGDPTCLNHTVLFRLNGSLQTADFQNALSQLAKRHECLRTRFVVEGGQPRKSVIATSQVSLERYYIHEESKVYEFAEALQCHIFDWGEGETMRVALLSLSSTNHFLAFATHSLVMDRLSSVNCIRELMQLYEGQTLSDLVIPFSTYDEKQKAIHAAGGYSTELRFWKDIYQDIPPPLPILRVSLLGARPPSLTFKNNKFNVHIDASFKSSVNAVCQRYRVTPFHFYLATLRALLWRYTKEEEIAIGIEDANRIDGGRTNSIGPYVNPLPLRFHNLGSLDFGEMLQETRTRVYLALANSRLPFRILLDELGVPRSLGYTPIFQCFFDYRLELPEKQQWGEISIEICSFQASKSPYDLALNMIDNPNRDCLLKFVARGDLYTNDELSILAESYQALIASFALEPHAPLFRPLMHKPEDIAQAMNFSRGPTRGPQWPRTLIGRVDEMAAELPENRAVQVDQDTFITYSQLRTHSHAIATALITSGASHSSRIVVIMKPSFDWIASILAIWRIGAVYIPLDICTPRTRLQMMVRDCKADVILTDSSTDSVARELGISGRRIVNLSRLEVEGSIVQTIENKNGDAVILYTSGSSAAPKGILLKHEGLCNWMEHSAQRCGLTGAETVLQQSSMSFDMSITQVFLALCYGGAVQLVPQDLRGDAREIVRCIVSGGVSFTSATPSEYLSWLTYGPIDDLSSSSWKTALSAGEPVQASLLDLFASVGKDDLRFFNSYGPTEITLVASAIELPIRSTHGLSKDRITAGYPLPNYSIYVLDDNLQPVPVGVQGEIFVGGAGVSSGYVRAAELTAEMFLEDPFVSSSQRQKGWHMMHRTGDLGRWTPQGALVVENRIIGDTQIKFRGQRIDLREVEAALIAKSDGRLSEAVVSVRRETAQTSEILVAHVRVRPNHEEEMNEQWLMTLPSQLPLPSYMWPSAVIPLEYIPRTVSGKLDRRAIEPLTLPKAL